MIAKLLHFALRQRFITIVMGLTLAGLGIWAFQQLKIEAYPDISDTQVVVITLYPGHAAEEVEQQVTVPIERVLRSTLRRAALTILLALVAVSASLFFVPGSEFLPQLDEGTLWVRANLPSGISLAKSSQVAAQIRLILMQSPEVELVSSQ